MQTAKKLNTLKCASCGGNIEISNPRTKFVTCPYCGTTTDISRTLKNIKKGNPQANKPLSFLKLGMIGYFENIPYKIIGRTRWINTYREYDSSENEYSTEKWTFDEWALLSNEGKYKTIIEDKEGFYESKTIIPKYPGFDKNNSINDFFTKAPRRVQEFGTSRISYFEGESNYLITLGDSSEFILYQHGDKDYSIEWRLKNNEIFEIEFFEEQTIDRIELAKKFKSEPEIAILLKKTSHQRKRNIWIRLFFILLGLIDILIAILYMGNFFAPTIYRNIKLPISKLAFSTTDNYTSTAYYTLIKYIYINPKISSIKLRGQSLNLPKEIELKIFYYICNTKNDTLAIFRNNFYNKEIFKNKKKIKYARKTYFSQAFSTERIKDTLYIKLKFLTPAKNLPYIKKTKIQYLIKTKATRYNYGYGMIIIGFIIMIFGFKTKLK